MNTPSDRFLIMFVVATGFAVLLVGWAASLVRAETTGWTEIALGVGVVAVFVAALVVAWRQFGGMDRGVE